MPSSTESLTAEEMDLIYLYREVPPSAQAFIKAIVRQGTQIAKNLPE